MISGMGTSHVEWQPLAVVIQAELTGINRQCHMAATLPNVGLPSVNTGQPAGCVVGGGLAAFDSPVSAVGTSMSPDVL